MAIEFLKTGIDADAADEAAIQALLDDLQATAEELVAETQ